MINRATPRRSLARSPQSDEKFPSCVEDYWSFLLPFSRGSRTEFPAEMKNYNLRTLIFVYKERDNVYAVKYFEIYYPSVLHSLIGEEHAIMYSAY